jgi:ribonuclease P protein component
VKRGFRLSRPADFKRVRRLGKSYAHPFVVLIAMPNELGKVRVAVAAGKPIGGAVLRNRAKRLLRAGMLPLLERISPGQDIVLIAKAGIREKKSTQVKEVLVGLLQKGKLLKTKE